MHLARRNGDVCIRCAFRLRLLTLQQSRQKSQLSEQSAPKIRYYGGTDLSQKTDKPFQNIRNRDKALSRWGLDERSIQRRREQLFQQSLAQALVAVKAEVKNAPLLQQLSGELDDKGNSKSFKRLWKDFAATVVQNASKPNAIVDDLRHTHRTSGDAGVESRLKYAFYGHVTNSRFTASDIKNQQEFADLRYPNEWFPATRSTHRTIHLHVGPTNSGKTYHALQKLEQAETGIYAGPLRLLAHEVYSRLNAKGIRCALFTGEERRLPPDHLESSNVEWPAKQSCTVEMIPYNKTLDVAVIDEIQMIGNAERGWAWTQALLGVKAKEVHLCGEERTVPLIREICASVGEKLEIHRYKRLSPLKMSDQSLYGDLSKLRKGDCIVSFSVMGIHALRKQIEQKTGRKVATVYGSLPPETRAQQARLFNDPDNDYDFLVASDAVGMGLNLAIKRVVFETSSKFDGLQRKTLSVADIKQIGGRAGRFKTALQAERSAASEQSLPAPKGETSAPLEQPASVQDETQGLVTTLEQFDYPVVASAMESEPEPIVSAGLFPPASVVERFASYFPPGTPFSYILTRLHELSQMHERFHLCGLRDQVWVADMIESVLNLTIADRITICCAPASKADKELWKKLMPVYARNIGDQTPVNIADIQELPIEVLEQPISASKDYLRELERLHKGIVTYLWLSYRFAGIFRTRALAFHLKGMVEERIEEVLKHFSFTESQRRRIAKAREQHLVKSLLLEEADHEEERTSYERSKSNGDDGAGEGADTSKISHDFPQTSSDNVSELQYEEFSVSERPNVREYPPYPEQQASATAGDDRFAGEEDISFEDPLMLEEATRNASDPAQANDDSKPSSESKNEEVSSDVEEEPPRKHEATA